MLGDKRLMQVTHEIDEHLQKVRVGEFDSLVKRCVNSHPKNDEKELHLATA